MKSRIRGIFLLLAIVLPAIASWRVQAQITSESGVNGTGTNVNLEGDQFNITGGSLGGENLFHSFEQFGLEEGQIANFILNNPDIENILGRIVGGDSSLINGILRITGGNANLFLMNPAGIVFGPNVRLDLPGSFTATTATGIGFGEDNWFNAFGANDYENLVGTPNTFIFEQTEPRAIINRGNLEVKEGQNLTLIGGSVLNEGDIIVPGGNLTISAVPGENLVRISQPGSLLSLEIEPLKTAEGENQAIQLEDLPILLTGSIDSSEGRISSSSKTGNGGEINLNATNQITTGSIDSSSINGDGGSVRLKAGGDIEVDYINAEGGDNAIGGEVDIETEGFFRATDTFTASNGSEASISNIVGIGSGSSDITIKHDGNEETPFIVGDATENGTAGSIITNGNFELVPVESLIENEKDGKRIIVEPIFPQSTDTEQPPETEIFEVDLPTEPPPTDDFDLPTESFIPLDTNDLINVNDFNDLATDNNDSDVPVTSDSTIDGTIINDLATDNNDSDVPVTSDSTIDGTIISDLATDNNDSDVPVTSDSTIDGTIISDLATDNNDSDAPVTSDSTIDGTIINDLATDNNDSDVPVTSDSTIDGTIISDLATDNNDSDVPVTSDSTIDGTIINGLTTENQNNNTSTISDSTTENQNSNTSTISDSTTENQNSNTSTISDSTTENQNNNTSTISDSTTEQISESKKETDTELPTETTSQLALRECNQIGANVTVLNDNSSGELEQLRAIPTSTSITALESYCRSQASSSTKRNRRPVITYEEFDPNSNRPDIAAQHWHRFLAIAQRNSDRNQERKALRNLGLSYHSLAEYPKAIEYHQQSLKLALELNDRYGEVAALGSLGKAYTNLGNYTEAINYHQQSLKLARELGSKRAQAAIIGNLGITYHFLDNYPQAIEYHQQHLKIAREIGDRQGEGAALGNLGIAYRALGNYAQAINYYQQQLSIAQAISDRQGESNALGNLGNAYQILGEYVKAIEYHQRTLAIKQYIDDRQGEARVLGNLGNAYEVVGDYNQALEYYQQALTKVQKIGDRHTEGSILRALGVIQTDLGNNIKAISYYQQSLEIAQAIDDRQGEASSLNKLGFAYYLQGDLKQALELTQQSLAITRQLGDRRTEVAALGTLGLVYEKLDQIPIAIDYHHQSWAKAQELGVRGGEWGALAYLGNALFQKGNFKQAEEKLRDSLEILESLRPGLDDLQKVSLVDTQIQTYALLQQVLVAQGKTQAALEIAERGRARAFVELLSKRLSPEAATKSAINQAPPTIEEIKTIAKQQNATLVQYSIVPEEFLLQGKLRGKPSQLYIWVVQPSGEVAFRQVDLKQLPQQNTSLKKLVLDSRNFRRQRSSEAARKKLHQLLIEPISELLPTNPDQHVIFIPQDSLFLLPFPALQDSSGKYLIEKHTTLTAPAIQVLELTRQQQQRLKKRYREPIQGDNALVVGNPLMPGNLMQLPGTEVEAKEIAQLLNTEAVIGKKATRVEILQQMPSARLIHLATHGLLDDMDTLGMPGAIALAPSPEDDGFLRAGEILDLKLNAELVVLSACDTGRGEITGDGVIGLSRSLIAAGVPSVLVSLWAVPDAPTTELMIQFYRQMQQNQDQAQALRHAMLKTMQKHPNPISWAAFTLIGEAE
ncbi:MAG: tetratricopeptide repeat protein [Symploca sp. SIO2B6]|nr:tetratricopeptide repeat protein [Symploca sp. SIO2B6]